MEPELLTRSLERIDRYNDDDPNRFGDQPLARHQGERAHHWVLQLDDEASVPLQLAARAHHVGRWELPRTEYDAGRNGYLRWRREQKTRHADLLAGLLADVGVAPETIERTTVIVQKKGLGTDDVVQTFEDAVCLAFIETQFLETADKLGDDDKMVDVVAKTLRKMSPAGHAAAATLNLDPRSTDIIQRATQRRTD